MSEHDPVNKPSHYQVMPGVEVYDVRMALMAKIEGASHSAVDDWSRAWEYLTRMWGKNGLEDAKKARWYLDKLIDKLEAEPAATVAVDLRGSAISQATRAFFEAAIAAASEPAAQIDDESDRQKAVEQNGNDGAVYDDPWYGAPEWARFKAQDKPGEWYWFDNKPEPHSVTWDTGGNYAFAHDGAHNPNWRDTLIERPVGQDPQE